MTAAKWWPRRLQNNNVLHCGGFYYVQKSRYETEWAQFWSFFGSIRLFLIWGIRLNTDFEQIKKEICCWHQFTYLHTYVRVCVGVLYVIIWYQLYCRDTLGIGGLSIDRRPPSKNLWSRRVWTVSHSNIGLGFVETAYASIVEEAGFGIFEI